MIIGIKALSRSSRRSLTFVTLTTLFSVLFAGLTPTNFADGLGAQPALAATGLLANSDTDWCDVGMTAAQCGINTFTGSRADWNDKVEDVSQCCDYISLAAAGLTHDQRSNTWSGTILPSAAGKRIAVNVLYLGGTWSIRQMYRFSIGYSQTLVWNPTNTALTASPTAPSELARVTSTVTPATVVTYSAGSYNSSQCQVNSSTGTITFWQTGECYVIARVEAIRSGATSLSASTKSVMFNIVGWPTITSLGTTSGSTAGGTSVAVSGSDFYGVTSVKFGASEAQSFTVYSGGYLVAVAPRAISTGAVYVSVTNAKGTGGSALFTYTKGYQSIALEPSATQDLAVGGTVNLSSSGYLSSGSRTYTVSSGASFCTISGSTLTATGVGSCAVTASIADTTAFYAATSTPTTFRISRYQQVVTWSPEQSLTVNQSPYAFPPASALGGAVVSYSVVSSTLSTCTVVGSNGTLTFSGVGECRVKASVSAIGDYGAAEKTISFTSELASRSLTWTPQTNLTPNQSGFEPGSATGVGSPVITYTVLSSTNGCSVNSSTGAVSFTGVGTCLVRASTPATSTYAAGVIERSFTVARLAPQLLWSPILNLLATQGQEDFASASTLSNSPISYSVTDAGTTNCALVNAQSTQLTFDSAGSCEVTATVAENGSYSGATSVATFAIDRSAQNLVWQPTTSMAVRFDPIYLSAAAVTTGGGMITYVVSGQGAGCTLPSKFSPVLTIASAGSCTVTAYAAETGTYAAGSASHTFTFSRVPPSLMWLPSLNLLATGAQEDFAPAASLSDSQVSYSVTSAGTTNCALVSAQSTLLTFDSAGSCQVTASVAESSLYEASSSVQTFAIGLGSQTFEWAPTLSHLVTLEPINVSSATGMAGGGAISYAITSGAGCSMASNGSPTLSVTSAGDCTVTAYVAQTASRAAATISKVFTFTRSVPTLSWNPVLALVKNPLEQSPSALAVTSSDAAIVYNVVSAGTSSCVVNQATGALVANGVGVCEVEASTIATNLNEAASLAVRFSITLQRQTIQIVAGALEITEGGLVDLTSNSQQGVGAVSYSILSGVGCEIVGDALRAIAPGVCVVRVDISADDQFAAASSTLEIRVRAKSMVEVPETTVLPIPEDAPSQEINLPLPISDEENQRMAGLPAGPAAAKLVANRLTKTATLVAKLPALSGLAPITETVVEVRDAKRKLIARISVKVKVGDSEVSVTIPFISGDYSVSVFNVNELGVSAGAPAASQLVHARTFRNAVVSGGIAFNGTVASSPIFFKAFSAKLDADDRRSLDRFAKQIGVSAKRVYITGFAYQSGSTQKEVAATSLARARNVAKYLASKGVRVWITYFGAGAPVKSAGFKDRRVELRVLG